MSALFFVLFSPTITTPFDLVQTFPELLSSTPPTDPQTRTRSLTTTGWEMKMGDGPDPQAPRGAGGFMGAPGQGQGQAYGQPGYGQPGGGGGQKMYPPPPQGAR
jgi:hypothetical protein